jgi:apolipoprotein N-acyltransferase
MAQLKLNIRQTIEGMPLAFNAKAAGGLSATVQFDVTGTESGVYHLRIVKGECTFHIGPADEPTLTINTPSDVWLKISRGELSGQTAFMQGLYTASGDLSLLLRMDSLFKSTADADFEASTSQHPAGPIRLSGMAWMTVAFIPWILHWVMFDIPGVSRWISVGLPLLLSILIVSYRLITGSQSANSPDPTWLELGGLGFFTLASVLALTGDIGFSKWGSIVSSVVMGSLWLGSLLFSKTPLSAEYSKWGFIKTLWQNSMFIYPNAVISLMWGWQYLAAALLGVVAILLYEATMGRLRFWAGIGLSVVSGLLLSATMPGFDVGLLGWLALVPLLLVVTTAPVKQHYILALPFGLVFSIAVHNWYPNIFSPALGFFLIIAVGTFYAGIIQVGAWLQTRLPGALKLLALPVAWSAVEFVKFITPFMEKWWFVLLAKSMWRFPPALQVLSLTGFPGLSFLVMLANVAIALLLLKVGKFSSLEVSKRASVGVLIVIASTLILGALMIPAVPSNSFTIAALTDMVIQDPHIPGLIRSEDVKERFNNPQRSQDILDVNESLTRQAIAVDAKPAIIVWPENKIAATDNTIIMSQLSELAQELNVYIVINADKILAEGQFQNVALMVGPDGEEVGQRAKIHLFGSGYHYGFQAGPHSYSVFDTPYGLVGIGVCYDYHFLDVARGLARSGAQVLLMPTDDDLNGSPTFPPFHASDGVFRAAENRVAMGLGTTNGLSMVIDPYGHIVAEGEINERDVIVGEVFTAPGQTLYTRWGDWFGWLMVGMLGVLVAISLLRKTT